MPLKVGMKMKMLLSLSRNSLQYFEQSLKVCMGLIKTTFANDQALERFYINVDDGVAIWFSDRYIKENEFKGYGYSPFFSPF